MTKRQVIRLARVLRSMRPQDSLCESTYIRLVRTVGAHVVPFMWIEAWNEELPLTLRLDEPDLQARSERLEELNAKQ
jgi:hypothetical protein